MVRSKFKMKLNGIYLKNSFWLFLEHGVRTISGVIVGIYVARYLGPENFGIYSQYIAIVAIFAAIGRLGFDSLLIKELILNPLRKKSSLASAYWLMQSVGIFLTILLTMGAFFFDKSSGRLGSVYIFLACGWLLFQPMSFVESYFQAAVRIRGITIAKILVLATSGLVKIGAVTAGLPLVVFFLIAFFEQLLQATFFFWLWKQERIKGIFQSASTKDAMRMLSASLPLMVSALAINLYTKIDQVMINSMVGHHAGGLYSAAVKIYESWTTIPYLVCISVFPAILHAKSIDEDLYERRMIMLMRYIFWVSILIAGFCYFFSNYIIQFSFGSEYSEAGPMLTLVMFSSAWAALGTASTRFLIAESLERFIALRTLSAALLNVCLNFLLIPKYGAIGAIWATIVCSFLSNYMFDYINSHLKRMRKLKNSAIAFLPYSS